MPVNGIALGPTIAKMLREEGTEAELLRASVYGDARSVRNLVDADSRLVNLERGGPRGTVRWGPILLACMYGQRDVVEALLDRGASLSQYWHGSALLHHAAQNGYTQVVELLIQRGADVNALATNTNAKVTPLLI
jgi:ankyrin repeat protein